MKKLFKKAAEPFVRCFWALQIYVLRTFPPFQAIISGISMNANRSASTWLRTLFLASLKTPRALSQHCRDIRKKQVVIARISIGVTSCCTLCCDKCGSHIPDVLEQMHTPREDLLADIRFLLSCVDCIYLINISGGEAFLHPNLEEVIQLLGDSDKVGAVILITNGTVVPSETVLCALRDAGVIVKISKYGPALQPNVEALKAALKEYGIPYIHEVGSFWYDAGDLSRPLPGSAKRRFRVCIQPLCVPYWDGKIYLCPESIYFREKNPEKSVGDYVDLRKVSPAEFREQFKALQAKRVVAACEYCAGFTYKSPKVPPAVQRERPAGGEQS